MCTLCNGYIQREWNRRPEFKSCERLFVVPIEDYHRYYHSGSKMDIGVMVTKGGLHIHKNSQNTHTHTHTLTGLKNLVGCLSFTAHQPLWVIQIRFIYMNYIWFVTIFFYMNSLFLRKLTFLLNSCFDPFDPQVGQKKSGTTR